MKQEKEVKFLGLNPSGKKVNPNEQTLVKSFGSLGRWFSGPDYSPLRKKKKSVRRV